MRTTRYAAVAVVVSLSLGAAGFLAFAAPTPLAITSFSHASGTNVIAWSAETNSFGNLLFNVERASSPLGPFTTISPALPETTTLVFTDTVSSAGGSAFYRVAAAPAYTPLSQPAAFSAYAATNVGGLNTVGYAGAVFDGRYIYFVPYQDNLSAHGRVLRYDTQGTFTNAANWAAYDASNTGAGGAVGYTGGAFDGRYVYFSPQGTTPHGRVLRYDTQGAFSSSGSWTMYDAGTTDGLVCKGFQGVVFDGRFLYFVPHYNGVGTGWNGIVLCYDTQGVFTNSASWHAYDAGNVGGLLTKGYSSGVYDGHYVYFAPTVNGVSTNGNGCVLRYDTHAPLTNGSSWSTYDASATGGLMATIFKGAVFDGRYVFFVPYINGGACTVLRYDSQNTFTNAGSWTAFNATNIGGIQTEGYDGAVFDGRYIHFAPYRTSGNLFEGRVLSFDTQGTFTNVASWHAVEASGTSGLPTQGYVGAVSDGRYVYFAPFRNTNNFNGIVLRFDARLPRCIPATVSGGSNL